MLKNFEYTDLELKPDYEGEVKAVLISHTPSLTHRTAVLYIHGFSDYFFQTHLAHFYHSCDVAFYALDLRKYGRALMPHQRPNFSRSFTEYFEEISTAVNRIKEKHDFLILNGHSTGTLSAALFCNEHPNGKKVDALFLNSPFFAFPYPDAAKRFLLPAICFLGKYFPYKKLPGNFSKLYCSSLHKDYYGEWNFDFKLKPLESFSVYAGWVLAVFRAQKRFRRGLKRNIPVLILHSNKSISRFFTWTDEMHYADAVLNVKDMRKYSGKFAKKLTKEEIPDAVHDVFLSKSKAREKAFTALKNWIEFIRS